MTRAGRTVRQLPTMSMLDLLFGVFGVMIVLAAAFAQQRVNEPRIDRTPFAEIVVSLAGLNLDMLFVDFHATLSDGSAQRWSPLFDQGDAGGSTYLASLSSAGPTASLRLSESFLLPSILLRASLQNLPRLPEGDKGIEVTLIIRTAHGSCSVQRSITAAALRDLETESLTEQYAPSVFALFAENSQICQTGGLGLAYSVVDGWLELDYALL